MALYVDAKLLIVASKQKLMWAPLKYEEVRDGEGQTFEINDNKDTSQINQTKEVIDSDGSTLSTDVDGKYAIAVDLDH